ncbi:aldose 1-epimerase family protein [Rudaeicoccus suwonensis]|uniref:Aldose 1-epimerase n=1 Tax=Rudaeicoccus suwonensis TaxID=657409 RepID=A0A561DVF2_9MICO|nr:aldose 1-epimerase family protein [Rudaeicoccus suwonensis]TWE07332.1 aldose 1-epimerase [Rudaeicoccus suwonensis]
MPDSTALSPSGEQWTITYADQSVTVVQIGGGLRTYDVAGRPVIHGYPEDAKADAGRGQLLVPWPNRIADGVYEFDGKRQQLPLTEPAKHNASHGLVRWESWQLVQRDKSSLRVAFRLMPQPGWDGILDLDVTYALDDGGLTVTPSAVNRGSRPVPFGFGAHPYLTTGEQSVDELTLHVPAASRLVLDDRLLPTGHADVAGTDADFRQPHPVDGVVLDQPYTDLLADDDGKWRIRLAHNGISATLWAEAATFPYAQVFTADTLPEQQRRRSGVAVEPMTCPAGAFATGEGLIVLEPEERWQGSWGISPE